MSEIAEIENFLSSYTSEVRSVIFETRKLLLDEFPDVQETVDIPARLIAYSFGTGYKDMICVLIPSKKDAKLSFAQGATLSSLFPELQGNGKKTRYVSLFQAGIHETVVRLCRAALDLHRHQTITR